MRKAHLISTTLAALLTTASFSVIAQTQPVKGTICFAAAIRETEKSPIACKGLGKFQTVAEIYERGYRVVSSGVVQETPVGTVFFIIEEK